MTTDDEQVAERIRVLRNVGQSGKYLHVAAGTNERLDTIQAAVLRVKLRHLDRWNALRRSHAASYEAVFRGTGVQAPEAADWAEHVWHVYAVRTERREDLRSALGAQGIATGIHYPIPLHRQPALAHLRYAPGAFPVTEADARDLLSLPMFPELEPDEIDRVAGVVAACQATAA